MRELSLFSGVGGGLLGTKHLLDFITVGYVEIDAYCQAILAQRISDGFLDPAPIFGDIQKFISEGYARAYQGLVDVLTGGDPCQGNSAAWTHGKKQKTFAPEFVEVVRIVRPVYVIRENPSKLKNDAPSPDWKFKEWIEALGYTATLTEINTCCMGGDHQRSRMFVLAQLSDTLRTGLEWDEFEEDKRETEWFCEIVRQNRWSATPQLYRKSDGVAHFVDRLKSTGNGQVPRVVEAAWKVLKPRRPKK